MRERHPSVLTAHRAAVCGKPIGHSLSPVIHTAGFAAAGLLTVLAVATYSETRHRDLAADLEVTDPVLRAE